MTHRRLVTLAILALAALPPARGQESADYKITESAFTAGGLPDGGTILGSASFRISLATADDGLSQTALVGGGFRVDGGFVAEVCARTNETCNGVDDDCDGQVDEAFVAPTGWAAASLVGAPTPREQMSVVSTGDAVIVWGGYSDTGATDTGAIYSPSIGGRAGSWSAMGTATTPPVARFSHATVWTGTEMIVWGGQNSSGVLATGGRFDPDTNLWTPTSNVDAPLGRVGHTAVWADSRMIVWGGGDAFALFDDGASYDPSTDTWTPISTLGAPSPRFDQTAVWTGTEMIVWGGVDGSGILTSGARYNPTTATWSPVSTVNAPAARYGHSAIWSGSKMIIYGGTDADDVPVGDTFLYDPALDQWSNGPAFDARVGHSAVWDPADGLMIVWGGWNTNGLLDTGATFDPATLVWSPLPDAGAPCARAGHAAAWLSSTREMFVWGGLRSDDCSPQGTGVRTDTGGRIAVAPSCGIGACQREGSFTCSAGVLGFTCTPGTPGGEVCNGLDDNCDGTVDEGILAPSGSPAMMGSKSGTDVVLSWSSVSGATGYDVVHGDLLALRNSDGDFAVSTIGCVGDDLAGQSAQDALLPVPGNGLWYLVRPVNSCGNGSYDEGVASPPVSRDAKIAASAVDCP